MNTFCCGTFTPSLYRPVIRLDPDLGFAAVVERWPCVGDGRRDRDPAVIDFMRQKYHPR